MEPIRIDVHIHNDETDRKLDLLLRKVDSLMADISGLTASVAQNTTVIGSALTLINGFAAQLAAAGTDPVALAALQTQLNQSDTALAAAVAANTPAANQPSGPATPTP
jgi:hypothetical protein